MNLNKLLEGKTIKKIYKEVDKESDIAFYEDEIIFNYSDNYVVILFEDGTKIKIQTSEWGHISLVE